MESRLKNINPNIIRMPAEQARRPGTEIITASECSQRRNRQRKFRNIYGLKDLKRLWLTILRHRTERPVFHSQKQTQSKCRIMRKAVKWMSLTGMIPIRQKPLQRKSQKRQDMPPFKALLLAWDLIWHEKCGMVRKLMARK